MKIGITADPHLKSINETPERYDAIEKIINYLNDSNINHLIIAGDLFDKERYNYNDFDTFCIQHQDIIFYIIPGNHDAGIEQRYFSADNIKIITNPEILNFNSLNFLFVPYDFKKSMDESIDSFISNRDNFNDLNSFVIVGHGDYMSNVKIENIYETGVYMPLSSNIVNKYNPLQIFLGHIHKPSQLGKVWYSGSPYPLDINETGKKRFLTYDTQSNTVDSIGIDNEIIYFIETILMLPVDDELAYINKKLEQMINNWQLSDVDINKVTLRLSLFGYTKDINSLVNYIKNFIKNKGIKFYDANEVNISNLKIIKNEDNERNEIFKEVRKKIDSLPNLDYADKDSILEKTMEIIFK